MLRDVTWASTSCSLSVLMLCCEIWFEWAECSDWDKALGFWFESGFRSRPDVVQSKLIPVWIGLAVWTSPYRLIGLGWPGRTNKSSFFDFGKVPFPPLLFLSIPSSSTSLSTSTLSLSTVSLYQSVEVEQLQCHTLVLIYVPASILKITGMVSLNRARKSRQEGGRGARGVWGGLKSENSRGPCGFSLTRQTLVSVSHTCHQITSNSW